MKIPFNNWSRKRIAEGKKFCTSRHKKYISDDRVEWITPLLKWGFIKKYFWRLEGADTPEQLQTVIDNIYNRKVEDDEEFYVHFGDFSEPQTLLTQPATQGL